MKKMFTKLFSVALLMGLTVIGFAAKAQSTSLAGNTQTASAKLLVQQPQMLTLKPMKRQKPKQKLKQ